MFDMPVPLPIETASSEQVRYWEDSRFTEASQELDSSTKDFPNSEPFRILSTLDAHFVPIYEKSLDLADWLESLTERLLNEENPDPELVNELRNFVVFLVKTGAIHQTSSEVELLNQEIADLFVEDEENFSADEFMFAPNNPYKMEWRFPNWNDDFIVKFVPCSLAARSVRRQQSRQAGRQTQRPPQQQVQPPQQPQPQQHHHEVKAAVQPQQEQKAQPKHKHHRSKSVLKKTWHFIKKHRKTIIIVAVAVTAVAITAGLASGAAAGAVAAAAAPPPDRDRKRTSLTSNENGKAETSSSPPQPPSKEGSFVQQQSPVPATSKLKDEFLNQKPPSLEKELAKDRRSDFDIGKEIKEAAGRTASLMAHSLWEPLGQLRESGKQVFDVMGEVAVQVLPFVSSPKTENSSDGLTDYHQNINEFFGRNPTEWENWKKHIQQFATGVLPGPGGGVTSTVGKATSAAGRALTAEQKAVSLAERMAAEVNAGALEGRVATVVEGTFVKESSVVNAFSKREFTTSYGKVFNDEMFLQAGQEIDRASFTKAGRGSMKHGYRVDSAFPKPIGNPSQVNEHGQKMLEMIIKHPERIIQERPHPDFGRVIDITVPEKGGARFTIDGKMVGFLEP